MQPEYRPAPMTRRAILTCFPRLRNVRWRIKSPFDRSYKCIAWAACRTDYIWWPYQDDPPPLGVYWPPGIPRNRKVDSFVAAFEQLGYERCDNRDFEFGYQKVAIYAWDMNTTTHMARQHFLGRGWLSKPGILEDILHPTLESIESEPPHGGADYGIVFQVMRRNWWKGLLNLCLFRCAWYAVVFWLYRLRHRM